MRLSCGRRARMREARIGGILKRVLVAVAVAAAAGLIGVAKARAEPATTQSVPIEIQQFVPCANGGAGEVVQLSGRLLIVEATTIDASGGFHLTTQVSPQDVAGIGLTT